MKAIFALFLVAAVFATDYESAFVEWMAKYGKSYAP